ELDTLERADGDFYQELPPEDEPAAESLTTEGLFGIVAAVFKPGNKWRLVTPSGEAHVAIEDSAFLKRVQDGDENFGAGDILRAKYRQDLYRLPRGGYRGEITILEILDHKKGPKPLTQPPLPLGDDKG